MKKSALKIVSINLVFILSFTSCIKKEESQTKNEDYHKIIQNTIHKLESENIQRNVLNCEVYFGKDSTKKVSLKDFTKRPRLLFYFSYNTCVPCIEETVEIIKETFSNYEQNDKIVFVSPDYPLRYSINCYGKKLLRLSTGKLGLPIETGDQPPFFIVINKNMEIESIHVVNKLNFERTRKCLNEIALKYALK